MLEIKKFSAIRVAACLTAAVAALALSCQASFAADATTSNQTGASARTAQRAPVRNLLGINPRSAASNASNVAPSYAPAKRTSQSGAPLGNVRLRNVSLDSKSQDENPAFAVSGTQDQTPAAAPEQAVAENAEQAPVLATEQAPAENADQSAAESQEQASDAAQNKAAVPQDDENARLLEERKQAEAAAQGPDVSIEIKNRVLTNTNDEAPDARVRLSDLDVSGADVAEQMQEQNEAPVAKPAIETPETPEKTVAVKPINRPYGYTIAEKAVRDMSADLLDNLKARGGAELYARWRTYNASIRSRTNSLQTGNELNNRCRLRWYEALYQDPLNSLNSAEEASRAWADDFMGDSNGVLAGMRFARVRMDVPNRNSHPGPKAAANPTDAIDLLKSSLVEAASLHAKAVAPLSKNDLAAVMNEGYSVFCGQVESGHTIPSRGRGMYLIDALEKMNKGMLYDAGETVLSLLNEKTLEELGKIDFNSLTKTRIGDNQTVGLIPTEAGDILVGGPEKNVWDLDKYPKACCILDLGGNDVYKEGACVLNRPLFVVLDLGNGDDQYTGKNYAIQGGALLGVSMWYDQGGDDTYLAKDLCQGSAIGGVGILINESGNDKYMGFRRVQGAAICGFALCLDRAGDDDYRAALLAQGFGAPGGFGALVDRDGKDHYYVGGYFFDSYPEHPGYDGWGQGIGAGIRRCACGGIGVILDGGGDDSYECDYFGHGGGYWMGVGVARDFGGNDVRYAATSTMYDGTKRREQRWTRFVNGFGCHYAVGYLFDDYGNDVYGGTIMGDGMGWDLAAGFLVDFDGNDSFEATGGLTQGAGAEGSIGAILNYRGADTYYGNSQGYSNGQLSYHAQSNCGANFSFVIDHGGKDVYGGYDNYNRPIQNNAITQRGYATGMIVDRPAPDEEKASADAKAQVAPGRGQTTTQGFLVAEAKRPTMVADPPLYDTNPHPTSSGINAFNASPETGMGMGGGGGFLRGFFGGGM